MNANNHHHYIPSSQQQQQQQQQQGPRAKCDQVIFEAITKAAEIIVRGRCARLSSEGNGNNIHNASLYHPHYQPSNKTTHYHYPPQPSCSASSGRFNIQVEEVQAVRSTLQRWKQSLHVPLRLDVYYQYKEPSNNSNESNGNNVHVRRELLERWCIDYVASKPNNHHHASQNGSAMMDDSSILLRSVCKRIVTFLRTLYSMTRMMPGYKLHQALLQLKQQNNNNNYHNRSSEMYGGLGDIAAGYYPSNSTDENHNRETNSARQEGTAEDDEGGIHFSFYASTTEGDALSLFSSTSNSPFSRHELNSVPTPFGMLHLTVLYDASLNVERALLKKLHFQKLHPNASHSSHSTVSKAIPIASHNNNISAGNNRTYQKSNSLPVSRIIDNYAVSPSPSTSNNDHRMTNMMPKSYNSNHPPRLQQHSVIQAQSYSPQTNKRTLRKMHSDSEQQYHHATLMYPLNRNKNNHTDSNNSNNNIQKPKRAVSGLSLALMGDDSSPRFPSSNSSGKSPSHLIQNEINNSPPSPLSLARVYSGGDDNNTAWKQRLALHHPPPTVEITSSSNHLHSRDYGYGYNNHNNVVPIKKISSINSNISAPSSPGSSTYPLSNTPPQPMFIGSGPRNSSSPYQPSLVATKSKEENVNKPRGGRISPPFRENPTVLKKSDIDVATSSTITQQNSNANQTSKSPSNQPYTSRKNIKNLTISPSNSIHQQRQSEKRPSESNILLPPLTSLDVLTTSPFKAPSPLCDHTTNGSMISSLSMNNNGISSSAFYGPAYCERSYVTAGNPYNNNSSYSSSMMAWSTRPQPANNSSNASMFRSSATTGAVDSLYNPHHKSIPDIIQTDYSFDEMPFAVDTADGSSGHRPLQNDPSCSDISNNTPKMYPQNNSKSPNEFGSSSVNTASSHLITSLAHRCATAGRLKLFSNTNTDQTNGNTFTSLSGNNDINTPCYNGVSKNGDKASLINTNNNGNITSVDSQYADTVSSLADQLAEFRSFGASLAGKTSSNSSGHTTATVTVEAGGRNRASSFSNRL